jgi:hypothetical protein
MKPTPKPYFSKKSVVLMIMVLGGAMLLASAASFSIYKEKNQMSRVGCRSELMVTIVFAKNTDVSPFELYDKKGNHYQPVLESNESVLSKTGPARVCYSTIEKNDDGLARIYINKVDYLPLPDEGK